MDRGRSVSRETLRGWPVADMSIGKISHTIRSLAATHDLAACVSGEVGAGATIRVKHAYGSLSSFVTGAIMQGEAHDGQVLCLTPDEDQASFLAADLTVILEATRRTRPAGSSARSCRGCCTCGAGSRARCGVRPASSSPPGSSPSASRRSAPLRPPPRPPPDLRR